MWSTRSLDVDGKFSFSDVTLSKSYLVELVQIEKKKIVCTEGPYTLRPTAPNKVDVNIQCGRVPAAIWLVAVAGGAGAAVAVGVRSRSK